MGFEVSTTAVFLSLELLGGLGMLLLLIVAVLSPNVHRSRAWYSFCISWVMSSFSFGLLLISGQQFNRSPPHGLCLTQAALIYACPPTTAATTSALLLEMWSRFRVLKMSERTAQLLLLSIPYMFWACLLVFCFYIGATKPNLVLIRPEADPYCIIDYPIIPRLFYSITILLAFSVLITLVSLIIHIKRSRAGMVSYRDGRSDRILLVRLIVFSGLGLIAILVSIVYVFNAGKESPGMAYDLSFAILPVSGVLIFGTQKDILVGGRGLLGKLLCRGTRTFGEAVKPTESEIGLQIRSGRENES